MTQDVKLQVVQITDGKFSAKGNFTAEDLQGNTYFISKDKMDKLGITSEDKNFSPFYITVTQKEYNARDEEGNLTSEKFTRTQAGAVFSDRATANNAVMDSKLMAIEQKKLLKDRAEEIGLSTEEITSLVASV